MDALRSDQIDQVPRTEKHNCFRNLSWQGMSPAIRHNPPLYLYTPTPVDGYRANRHNIAGYTSGSGFVWGLACSYKR